MDLAKDENYAKLFTDGMPKCPSDGTYKVIMTNADGIYKFDVTCTIDGHKLPDAEDDWTVYTEDGKPSAQWEVQVLVTEDGYEILAW